MNSMFTALGPTIVVLISLMYTQLARADVDCQLVAPPALRRQRRGLRRLKRRRTQYLEPPMRI